MSAPASAPLSPAQAAQAVGTSRWSVVRAIKAAHLRATRDNHGNWCIAPDDLAAWRSARAAQGAKELAQGARTPDEGQPAPLVAPQVEALRVEVEQLRVGLAVAGARVEAAEARVAVAEADRDAWRGLAERQQALLEDRRPREPGSLAPRPKGLLARLLGR